MLERTQGQPFNVKRRTRSEVEQERGINLANINTLKVLKKEQLIVTFEDINGNEEDIIINPITPAQLMMVGATIFSKTTQAAEEALIAKGVEIDSPEGEKYIEEQSEIYRKKVREDVYENNRFMYERKVQTCLLAIDSPEWIDEQILRSWPEELLDEVFETATEGVVGEDAVNAFPGDSEGSEEASRDISAV